MNNLLVVFFVFYVRFCTAPQLLQNHACSLHRLPLYASLWLFVSLTLLNVWNSQVDRTLIRLAQRPSVPILSFCGVIRHTTPLRHGHYREVVMCFQTGSWEISRPTQYSDVAIQIREGTCVYKENVTPGLHHYCELLLHLQLLQSVIGVVVTVADKSIHQNIDPYFKSFAPVFWHRRFDFKMYLVFVVELHLR